jgi:hypothetical protein
MRGLRAFLRPFATLSAVQHSHTTKVLSFIRTAAIAVPVASASFAFFAATFASTATALASLSVRVSLTTTAAAFALVRVPVRQFLGAGLPHRSQLHFEVQIDTRKRMIGIQQDLVTIDLHHANNRRKLIGTRAKLVTRLELTLDG